MPLLVPNMERKASDVYPSCHRDLDVLDQVETQAAPLLGDRVAEQAHLRGLLAQVVRDRVGGHDLQLARDHPGADEVGDLLQDVGEDVVGDVGVAGVHGTTIARIIDASPIPDESIR